MRTCSLREFYAQSLEQQLPCLYLVRWGGFRDMNRQRLDRVMVARVLVATRSQAESYIHLGRVTVNKKVVVKAGVLVGDTDMVELEVQEQYVSRAGLKLLSVVAALKVDFKDKAVLD